MKAIRHWGGLVLSLGLLGLSPLRAEHLVDDAGRFTVDIAQPTTRSDEASTTNEMGKTVMHVIMHQAADSRAYLMSYNDYEPDRKLDVEKSYEGIISGVVESMKGVMRSKTEHMLGDVAGWEYVLVNEKDKFVARTRCYIVGLRLYQLMYLGPPGTENSKEALKFLNSFRLLR